MILQFEPSPNNIFSQISRRNWWLCTDATRQQKDPHSSNRHDLIAMLHHVLFFILHISNKFHEEPLIEPHGGSSVSLPITPRNRDDTQTFWLWIWVFITFLWSVFEAKSKLNAVFFCGLMPAPLWRLQEHKKVAAHSLHSHPLPLLHSLPLFPHPRAKMTGYAQKSAGVHEAATVRTLPSSLLPFYMIIFSVSNIQ